MNKLNLLATAVLGGLVAGCVPTVPTPTQTVVHYGLEGKLTDSASGKPIAERHVSVSVDGREFDEKTNQRGEFKVAPELHHAFTGIGPIWRDTRSAKVDINLDGYAAYHEFFVVIPEYSESDPAPAPDQNRRKGNYLDLGEVQMKPRQTGTAGGQ